MLGYDGAGRSLAGKGERIDFDVDSQSQAPAPARPPTPGSAELTDEPTTEEEEEDDVPDDDDDDNNELAEMMAEGDQERGNRTLQQRGRRGRRRPFGEGATRSEALASETDRPRDRGLESRRRVDATRLAAEADPLQADADTPGSEAEVEAAAALAAGAKKEKEKEAESKRRKTVEREAEEARRRERLQRLAPATRAVGAGTKAGTGVTGSGVTGSGVTGPPRKKKRL